MDEYRIYNNKRQILLVKKRFKRFALNLNFDRIYWYMILVGILKLAIKRGFRKENTR